jgi:hypothetical protein
MSHRIATEPISDRSAMRIRLVSLLLCLMAAGVAVGQTAKPPQQPSLRTSPARLAQQDLDQFRSLRGAPGTFDQAQSNATASSMYATRQTSYQETQQESEAKVPAILSGANLKPANGPANAPANSPPAGAENSSSLPAATGPLPQNVSMLQSTSATSATATAPPMRIGQRHKCPAKYRRSAGRDQIAHRRAEHASYDLSRRRNQSGQGESHPR